MNFLRDLFFQFQWFIYLLMVIPIRSNRVDNTNERKKHSSILLRKIKRKSVCLHFSYEYEPYICLTKAWALFTD